MRQPRPSVAVALARPLAGRLLRAPRRPGPRRSTPTSTRRRPRRRRRPTWRPPSGWRTTTTTCCPSGPATRRWARRSATSRPGASMDGAVTANTARKPRMMGRQIYAYAMGFMLTGDETLLDQARAGNRLAARPRPRRRNGGWHADLDVAGTPLGAGTRWSQDLAYDAMGPAAYFFVTRDAEAEAAVLAARDALFDPARFWDATNGRIKDGLDASMTTEQWMGATGSWQLVAQLDPITAFELLVQPVLTDPARRDPGPRRPAHAGRRWCETAFWKDGIFWGSTGDVGVYGTQPHRLRPHPQGLLGAAAHRQAARRPALRRLPGHQRAGHADAGLRRLLRALGQAAPPAPPPTTTAPTGGPMPRPTSWRPRWRSTTRPGSPTLGETTFNFRNDYVDTTPAGARGGPVDHAERELGLRLARRPTPPSATSGRTASTPPSTRW